MRDFLCLSFGVEPLLLGEAAGDSAAGTPTAVLSECCACAVPGLSGEQGRALASRDSGSAPIRARRNAAGVIVRSCWASWRLRRPGLNLPTPRACSIPGFTHGMSLPGRRQPGPPRFACTRSAHAACSRPPVAASSTPWRRRRSLIQPTCFDPSAPPTQSRQPRVVRAQ
jgi:hypothetical protein